MAAKTDPRRQAIVDYCEWGIANAGKIQYSEIVRNLKFPRKLPFSTDCSGFATLAYLDANNKVGNVPDPNNNGYNGTGFTGTMMKNPHAKIVKTPKPGDLLIYGAFPGNHVVIYMYTWKGAWVVCSHGQDIGPLRMLQHKEEVFQGHKPVIYSYL